MSENRVSLDRVDEMVREAFRGLQQLGGRARPKDLFVLIAPRLHLSEHELELHKSGAVRWETLLRWYSVDCTKAGYLEKSGGYWALTAAGVVALNLPSGELIRSAGRMYRNWKRQQSTVEPEVEVVDGQGRAERQAVYEQAVEAARAGIEDHIQGLGPYDFQNLVAELLRGMGYHVPHIAPPGPDGGVDLVAYTDPLGTSGPRIRVQVKHRQSKLAPKDVRELEGLLRREGDFGLLVSSGGFTGEAMRETRSSNKHIEMMDLERLIGLWQEHYDRIREAGRALLPLVRVHFLAPPEE